MSNITKNSNPNKAHGHDNISIKIIQICGDSIIPPLKLIFESAIILGNFPECWKKGNIIPIYKRLSKNLIKIYRKTSLLQIFGKIFENVSIITYSNTFRRLNSSLLINLICVVVILGFHNYLPTLMKYIKHLMEGSLDTRGVFLDVSKDFDKL